MSLLNKGKHWLRDMFRYPEYRPSGAFYDEYWRHRDMTSGLNSFQRQRSAFLLEIVSNGDSVLDVGCGDGKLAAYLKKQNPHAGEITGLDFSEHALSRARERGVHVIRGDLRDPDNLPNIGAYDWITLFEVIEHVSHSEALLEWALKHARKGILFSVPNTGFFIHRLRLLLGGFPLQWRAHPSEHLRFWTLRDMRWWLKQLGYSYELHPYEGVSVLKKIWPSLCAAGLFIIIRHE